MAQQDHHPHLHHLEREVEAGLGAEVNQSQAVYPSNTTPSSNEYERTSTAATAVPTASPSATNLAKHTSNAGSGSGSSIHDPIKQDEKGNVADSPSTSQDEAGLLSGLRLYLVFLSLMLSVFMFALDQSIVATAIPVIVSDFKAFDQVSWVITGYFLTQCGLILLAGQLLTVLKSKHILLGAVFFFELGSLICAVAKNMPVLIFGRAIQGIGASGMFVSILAVIAVVTRVEQRAAFMSAFGIVFVISSVVGPLLGGVFTERVSWRWCFWINLPFGGLAAAAIVFLLPARPPERQQAGSLRGWQALKRMDYVGSGLILCCITCLLLALQWGGNDYAWGNWRIILLFILGGLLAIGFFLWEVYIDEYALIPMSIMKNRTEISASAAMFFFMMAMLGGTYQLPLFYQAGRHHSPEQSGIDIIPFMLSICVGIMFAGALTTKFGRYWPFIIAGPPISAVGYGLLYTIKYDTPNPRMIGFQILAGFGIGLAFQNALLAVQAEYAHRVHLLPQATGVVSFFQLTGAAIGIGIINTVQSIFLNTELKSRAPNVPFQLVRQSTEAIYTLPVADQIPVIEAYIVAITKSFIPIIAAIAIAWFAAFWIRNHNMIALGVKPGAAAA